MTASTPKNLLAEKLSQGRDELNLADFPISVLQWQQPSNQDGAKLQTVTYDSTRYDPLARRRIPQRVTLSSEEGLPTPSDERVVLGLLYVAKRANDFADAKVSFHPNELLRILRWPANVQHYHRLRDALRRLTALTIRYENAWFDIEGRQYEQEFATGIIASYRLARLKRGPKSGAEAPASWIEWRPAFLRSLQKGSLKRLDLDAVFALRLPIAQRMYRFLDKRFYHSRRVELDVLDFACGHIGVTRTTNIAEVKRRLLPAIAELERIGLIQPALEGRFFKLRRGAWQVHFEHGGQPKAAPEAKTTARPDLSPEVAIVRQWHLLWTGAKDVTPTAAELACAKGLIEQFGLAKVQDLIPVLVERMKQKWPAAKTFGAVRSYVAEAVAELDQHDRLRRSREESTHFHRIEQQAVARKKSRVHWKTVWQQLADEQRADITSAVIARYPSFAEAPNLLERECLEELARQSGKQVFNGSGEAEPLANGAQQVA